MLPENFHLFAVESLQFLQFLIEFAVVVFTYEVVEGCILYFFTKSRSFCCHHDAE